MILHFKPADAKPAVDPQGSPTAAMFVPVTTQDVRGEHVPSPWLRVTETAELKICDLDTQAGREAMAIKIESIPLYRINLELLIDKILLEVRLDDVRLKAAQAIFAPDDLPEVVGDAMAEKYAFAGVLRHPAIASKTPLELLDLYLRLYGPAVPAHQDIPTHLAALMNGYHVRMMEACDGFLWRGHGWARLDKMVYNAERVDHDPTITFESYVARGQEAAHAIASHDPKTLLAGWLAAERLQEDLCRDIDAVLSLPDIRRLPRWVRFDVFRILEREAMKQVFAEDLLSVFGDLPDIRRNRLIAEPIEENAKGEVSPMLQQLMNQTLAAEAKYAGGALQFADAAQRRRAEAERSLAA
ncbi:MAG TPA: hypothetical protein VIN59_08255 [Alphaproteobacteria bacterium]